MGLVLKRSLFRIKLYATVLLFIFSSTISSIVWPFYGSAHAIDNGKCDYAFIEESDAPGYDPCDTCGGVENTAISESSVTITDTPAIKSIFQALVAGGMNSVQAAAVMGNMYQESKFNSDVHEGGNDIGYGLVQWSFGRRTAYEAYAAAKGVAPSDIPTQIAYLFVEYNGSYKSALVGTEFETSTDVAKATDAWMRTFEVPALSPANDPAALNSVRIPIALQIYALYKDIGPAADTSSVSSVNCATSNGAVAGNIVETAIGFALTTPAENGMVNESDARDTYRAAKPVINPGVDWTDCGGFIATVMIASGVDKDYTKVLVSAQIAYLEAHPDKYQILRGVGSAADLQPGDILLLSNDTYGHTTMYTGKPDNPSVDASLNERVPSVRNSGSAGWMLSEGAIVARILK